MKSIKIVMFGLVILPALFLFCSESVLASQPDIPWSKMDYSYGLPMTITNFTMPGFLVLSAVPHSTQPAGKGRFIAMMQFSSANYFQVSPEVEEYLLNSRGAFPRQLDQADVDAIINLPTGAGFYIDAELAFANMFLIYGLTDSVDLAMKLSSVYYTGGNLDGLIYGFHDAFDLGQQGRPYVEDNKFQYVLGGDGQLFTAKLDGAPDGGLLDPQIFIRYAFPMEQSSWSTSVALGIKPPLHQKSENLIATDRWDFGIFLGLERRWERNFFILNAALVYPGKIIGEDSDTASYNRPLMPSINVSWLHRMKHWKNIEWFVQVMYAEHPLRELVDSEFTDLDFQITGGVKWHTRHGILGFGFTENLFNMDNTPDIGFHLGWEWAF